MEKIKNAWKKFEQSDLSKIIAINLAIFVFVNVVFYLKYEQVDDFIIYNLYSGLDGTYNVHGIYVHPLICFIIGMFFRILPMINWHTIFLLIMQFISFTIIGERIVRKNKQKISWLLYSIFAAIFYPMLLLLIQYTSVAALLIATAFFILMADHEEEIRKRKNRIVASILFTLGIMVRMQSLQIILPFFVIYAVYHLILWIRKKETKESLLNLGKDYLILAIITVIVYISNIVIYQTNDLYKEYMEYNDLRSYLHDLSYTSYAKNQEIFDEIGWTENDHYLFYTFNHGDENIFSKENLQKIIDYKNSKNDYYDLNLDVKSVINQLIEEMESTYIYASTFLFVMLIVAILTNPRKWGWSIIVFLVTIGMHVVFIVLSRSMFRVVIPAYILGSAMLIYFSKSNVEIEKQKENTIQAICSILTLITAMIVIMVGNRNQFKYQPQIYQNYQELIEYTNEHKENVYLYTVPSLQYRYYAYSVYQMPPKGAFSNLRVMGGWDMFTGNYYDFKERYDLEGTFLDVLKENVYVIDGDVVWSGRKYEGYIDHIVLAIKEHYQKEVAYEKVNTFGNLYIYKLYEVAE